MAEALTVENLKVALARVAVGMEAAGDELNALDAVLGDGDLGVTMVRGTRAIASELAGFPDDFGLALLKCAQAFTRSSGSTFGTLLATGLMAAAKRTKGRSEIAPVELAGLVDEALTAMSSRGKSQLGDKTVLDALDGVRRAIDGEDEPDRMLAAADEEVRAVLDRMRQQPARQGRARIFADRSVGLDDPGMVVILRILESWRGGAQ